MTGPATRPTVPPTTRHDAVLPQPALSGFSERDFYLAEFRGRTLAIALPDARPGDLVALEAVLAELGANRTRTLVLSSDRTALERLVGDCVEESPGSARDSAWAGRLWRELGHRSAVGILVPAGEELASACRRIALRLRLAKLVWAETDGPLLDGDGERVSWVDAAAVDALLADRPGEHGRPGDAGVPVLPEKRRRLLEEIRIMVRSGLPAVNLCSLDGVADDLFTFEGSGTFFARERYLEVRRLGLDEFDAAHELVSRGVGEGYLVARDPEQLEAVLSNAFGVFVEGRYLAGLGALLPVGGDAGRPTEPRAGEICSLYTLTRFLGEGVGGHLVGFALECAEEAGFAYVFACTTSARVRAFFERQGFRTVSPEEIPKSKWEGYPADRQQRVLCVRRDLDGGLEASPA